MKEVFAYRSIHQYLDEVFQSWTTEPNAEQIKLEKQKYWRMYNTHLKKERRRVLSYVSLSFTKKEYAQILKRAKGLNLKVSRYIKEQILRSDKSQLSDFDKQLFCQLLFSLLNDIQDVEDGFFHKGDFVKTSLPKLKASILRLENHLNQLNHDY